MASSNSTNKDREHQIARKVARMKGPKAILRAARMERFQSNTQQRTRGTFSPKVSIWIIGKVKTSFPMRAKLHPTLVSGT
jgi:hypothetical protein